MFRSTRVRLGAAVTTLVVAAFTVVVSASGAHAIRPRGERGGSVAAPVAGPPLPPAQDSLDWMVVVVLLVVAVAVALAGLADSSAWRHAHQHRHA
ncbi:hypothetical protein [Terrabacter carboxydivorans]|uniref:hypothetical protein n=1 Tax=Terrabacter carboxydivorans TaxID=619730 RepID=UPI0031D82256